MFPTSYFADSMFPAYFPPDDAGILDGGRGVFAVLAVRLDEGRGPFDIVVGNRASSGRGGFAIRATAADAGRGPYDVRTSALGDGRGSFVLYEGQNDTGRGAYEIRGGSLDAGRGRFSIFEGGWIDAGRGRFSIFEGGWIDAGRGVWRTREAYVRQGRGAFVIRETYKPAGDGRGGFSVRAGRLGDGRGRWGFRVSRLDEGRGAFDVFPIINDGGRGLFQIRESRGGAGRGEFAILAGGYVDAGRGCFRIFFDTGLRIVARDVFVRNNGDGGLRTLAGDVLVANLTPGLHDLAADIFGRQSGVDLRSLAGDVFAANLGGGLTATAADVFDAIQTAHAGGGFALAAGTFDLIGRVLEMWGQAATYKFEDGSTRAINVVFDEQQPSIDETDPTVRTTVHQGVVQMAADDVKGVAVPVPFKDRITIDGVDWLILPYIGKVGHHEIPVRRHAPISVGAGVTRQGLT